MGQVASPFTPPSPALRAHHRFVLGSEPRCLRLSPSDEETDETAERAEQDPDEEQQPAEEPEQEQQDAPAERLLPNHVGEGGDKPYDEEHGHSRDHPSHPKPRRPHAKERRPPQQPFLAGSVKLRIIKLAIQIGAVSVAFAVAGSIMLLANGETRWAVLGFLGAAILGLCVLNARRLAKKYGLP
jgi:hypothetical protein